MTEPMTPTQHLAEVALFVSERRRTCETRAREMDGEVAGYWRKRLAECDAVLAHIAAVAEAL